MTERPAGLDGLLDYVAERIDPVHMAKIWYEELEESDAPEAKARWLMLGSLLEYVEGVKKRLARFEKNMPSWAHGTPEDYDAWLRELTPVDRRLEFYQWIGEQAVTQMLDELTSFWVNDPSPPEFRMRVPDFVDEAISHVDPRRGADPAPSVLPKGKHMCDVSHHTHTDGMGYLPTCRLDSPE